MKFCKKYQEYMQNQEKKLPGVGFKKLKKILKRCRRDSQSQKERDGALTCPSKCPLYCPVCDGSFFPALLKEMSAIVGSFNQRVKKLLELHLASGLRKYFMWFKTKQRRSHGALIEEGNDLVTYAVYNVVAIRKILKKYDKIHYSKRGQAFKSQAQRMHVEILQSPWLYELMAFHSNLKEMSIVDGLKSAKPKSKCALCRQEGVYEGVVHLEELNIFLNRSFPKYWGQRIAKEKVERMQQVKEHWESLSRAFAGI